MSPIPPPTELDQPILGSHSATGFRTSRARSSKAAPIANQPSAAVPSADSYNAPSPGANGTQPCPPLPKRNKGSRFIAFVFLATIGVASYLIYSTCFQYKCFGVVQGRIITVSAPWSGNVSSWHVREGEQVKQGDMLALIDNIELRHQLESLQDDLMLNQAQIEAEMSRVQFLAQSQADRNRQAQAEYLQAKAELSSENAKLAEADARYARVKNLSKSGSISGQELEKLTLEISGLRKKIQMLSDAVEVLRLRTTVASESEQSHAPQLKPLLAKIEQLKSEMERLRDRIKLGSLTAPVGGRVVRRHSLTGETLVQASPVVDILEDNSTEIILYVPQKFADEFAIDKEVEVLVQPNDVRVRCVVVRIGSRFEPAPNPLLDLYQTNQYLLAVHIVPLPEFSHAVTFRMDATVTLPYQWREYWSDRIGETKSWWRNWTASASPATDVNENSNNED